LRILFVLSGNNPVAGFTDGSDSPPLKHGARQGASLSLAGHEIDYYYISGRGIYGYLRNIPALRRYIKAGNYDMVHAHYSLTAIAASLAGRHRMVVSLMGSDVLGTSHMLPLLRLFCRYRWSRTIVKTETMKSRIGNPDVIVLPNGVDTEVFRPLNREEARRQLGLPDKKIVLFPADPDRPEKNFTLASESFRRLDRDDAMLLPVHHVDHIMMPWYYNAADVMMLTSTWEGSVNTVKEAMACNLAVVSTDVGDVRTNTRGLPGYHITTYDPDDIAMKLSMALDQKIKTAGRNRIMELGLDDASVNNRLSEIYRTIISGSEKQSRRMKKGGNA
jgi:glycosyltransferase involved in cell wall biosynthesis